VADEDERGDHFPSPSNPRSEDDGGSIGFGFGFRHLLAASLPDVIVLQDNTERPAGCGKTLMGLKDQMPRVGVD
jgi:hypothetical protein